MGTINENRKNALQSPVHKIAAVLAALLALAGLVSGLVRYIQFIVHGSYKEQLMKLAEDPLSAKIAFSKGNTALITSGIAYSIFTLLIILSMIMILAVYLKYAHKALKVVMIIDFLLNIISVVMCIVSIITLIKRIWEQQEEEWPSFITQLEDKPDPTVAPALMFILFFLAILFTLFVAFVLMLIAKETRMMSVNLLIAWAFSNLLIPLVVLLLENIIPIVACIIYILLAIPILFLLRGLTDMNMDSVAPTGSKSTGLKDKGDIIWNENQLKKSQDRVKRHMKGKIGAEHVNVAEEMKKQENLYNSIYDTSNNKKK